MRICSLLPGITDTVIALGAVDSLVGVTHSCDIPDSCSAQVVTGSRITYGQGSEGIDRQVRHASSSLFDLNTALLEQLHPDLILTQALCSVCAVDENLVREIADDFSWQVEIRSFQPTTVPALMEMIQEIGPIEIALNCLETTLHVLNVFVNNSIGSRDGVLEGRIFERGNFEILVVIVEF